MPDEPVTGDAFGALLARQLESGAEIEIVERDDGYISAISAARYFDEPGEWPTLDVVAVERCRGRVLDIGAGAGRASLALQERGYDVLALDTSPAAVRVCRERGVRDTFTGTIQDLADGRPGPFDTFLLLGNNLGLLGTPQTTPGFLAALTALSSPDASIVGIGTNPYTTQDPVHLRHHERNRLAGRPTGQLWLRVRYRIQATPWFDYLFLSPEELERLVTGTGWRATDIHAGDVQYLAVLSRLP
jgi:SAM-dependent methyltransferase